MNTKKVLLSGFLAGLIMLAAGMFLSRIFGVLFPHLNAEYQNPALFRPWSDPVMLIYFICPFFLGLALSFVWEKSKNIVSGISWPERGVKFGLIYWLVSLSGMLISYSSFPISFVMVLSWTVSGLFQTILAGLIYSKMNP
jgi:hypothetical protein